MTFFSATYLATCAMQNARLDAKVKGVYSFGIILNMWPRLILQNCWLGKSLLFEGLGLLEMLSSGEY